MIDENIIQEMVTTIENMKVIKLSYAETLERNLAEIEISIHEIPDKESVLNDIQDYASISQELTFLIGLEAGMRLSNLINRL